MSGERADRRQDGRIGERSGGEEARTGDTCRRRRSLQSHCTRTTSAHAPLRTRTRAHRNGGGLGLVVGTAVIVAPVGRIGVSTPSASTPAHEISPEAINNKPAVSVQDVVLPSHPAGLGPVGAELYKRITDIQEGRVEWEGWGVRVD